MKHIVRYLLEGNGSIPSFVEDGGYFPISEEMIGLSVDDSKRHLPSTVYKLTSSDLAARILLIGYKDSEGNLLTLEQCQVIADSFFSQKGL